MAHARATGRLRRRSRNGGLAGLAARYEKAGKGASRVKVGLPSGAADYPDGTSVIRVGATHEFGDDQAGIPERPWMRSTMTSKRKEHRKLIETLIRRVARGELTREAALELLGTKVASDMRERIVDLDSPPNSPATIAAKGSSNPLVDTGHLRQQVTHEVVKKRGD